MLKQIFHQDKIVQVIGPATSIWEDAKIIAFESDWSLRVQWINWNNSHKYYCAKIEIPQEFCALQYTECWHIREAQYKP